mmetsp:Transcript_20000/g.64469  ORF Transcript_20000/g.64469 Transcript_20000/m.64469 type:complete len:114 (-) Transcript_20000:69-410(-)
MPARLTAFSGFAGACLGTAHRAASSFTPARMLRHPFSDLFRKPWELSCSKAIGAKHEITGAIVAGSLRADMREPNGHACTTDGVQWFRRRLPWNSTSGRIQLDSGKKVAPSLE